MRLFLSGTVPLLILLGTTFPGHAEDAPSRDAVQSAVGSDDIQREAPLPERVRQELGRVERQPELQRDRPQSKPDLLPERFHFDLPWLPYAILGVIGLGLLFLLVRFLRNRAGLPMAEVAAESRLAPPAGRVLHAATPEADRTFEEIDALADAGAFAEAMHRLLLLVQSRLRDRLESGLRPSLTSREILRRAKLPAAAAAAFGTLVAAVEISHFGLRAANAATYALCREQCRQLLAVTTGPV